MTASSGSESSWAACSSSASDLYAACASVESRQGIQAYVIAPLHKRKRVLLLILVRSAALVATCRRQVLNARYPAAAVRVRAWQTLITTSCNTSISRPHLCSIDVLSQLCCRHGVALALGSSLAATWRRRSCRCCQAQVCGLPVAQLSCKLQMRQGPTAGSAAYAGVGTQRSSKIRSTISMQHRELQS
jgi:hypothetical protein